MKALRRAWAFVVRDFRAETSYRFAFALQILGTTWFLLVLFFMSRMVGTNLPALQQYGGDLFSFVVLGLAPLEYLRVGVMGFSSNLRQSQAEGTLEALLVTRASLPSIVFGAVTYDYLRATLRASLFLAIGLLARKGAPPPLDVPAALAFFALSIVCFGALGILSASFVMIFKKGDPISILTLGTSTLFAGQWFPTEMLGRWQAVSKVLPLTWAIEGIRRASRGEGLSELWPELAILALFCAALVPTAAWAFRAALDRARRDGTLSHY